MDWKLKRGTMWALSVPAALLLIAGILFGFLQTGTGRSIFASAVSYMISQPDRKIELGRVEGLVPFDLRVDRITVSDKEGAWLTAKDVVLGWSPWALLRSVVQINEFSASSIDFERLASGTGPEEPVKGRFASVLDLLSYVRVKQLTVSQLWLGESVLGQRAGFGIDAGIREAETGRGRTIYLNLTRKDKGPETSAKAEMIVDYNPLTLSVNLDFREEPGGFLGSVLGMRPGPLQFALQGSGPLADWHGTARGTAGAYGAITAQIGLKAEQETALFLEGKLELAERLMPPRLATTMGGENSFGLSGRYSPGRSVQLDKGWLKGKGLRFEASGDLDLKSEDLKSDWILTVGGPELPVPSGFPFQVLTANGTVSGKLGQPEGTASLMLQKIEAGGLSIEDFSADVRLEPLRREQPPGSGFALKGTGKVKELSGPHGSIPGESPFDWSLEIEMPPAERIMKFTLLAESERNTLKGSVTVDSGKQTATIDVSLQLVNFKPVGLLFGEEIPEAMTLRMDLSAAGSTVSLHGSFKGQVDRLDQLKSPVGVLLGPETNLSGVFDLKQNLLTLSEFRVNAPGLRFKSNADMELSERKLKGDWELSLPELEPLGKAQGVALAGNIDAGGTFAGSFGAMEIVSEIKAEGLVWDGRKLPQMTANVNVRELPGAPNGSLHVEMRRDNEKLVVSTDFTLKERQLALSSLSMDFPRGQVKGNTTIDLQKAVATGMLEGRFQSIAPLGRIFGEKLEGNANFRISLSPGKNGQDARIEMAGNGIVTPVGNANKISLSAEFRNLPELPPRGKADLEIQELQKAGLLLNHLRFNVASDEKGMNFNGVGKGKYAARPLDFQTAGDFARTGELDRLTLKTLSGHYGDRPFKLQQTFAVRMAAGKVSFEKLDFLYGPGHISASGQIAAGKVLLDGRFEKIPVEVPPEANVPYVTGSADGELRLEGDLAAPSASMKLRVADMSSKNPLAKAKPYTLDLEGRLAAGVASLSAIVQAPPADSLKASLSAPLQFSLRPFVLSMPQQGALQGNMEIGADLSTLANLIPQPDHEFTGRAIGRFDIHGTPVEPQLRGKMEITGGAYQNLAYGTVLKNLAATVSADGRRLEIDEVHATDGGKGTLSAKGWVQADAANNFPVNVDVSLSNLALVRRPDANASVGGTIKLSGSAVETKVNGRLEVNSAEMSLQFRRPPSVSELNVIEINDGAGPAIPRSNRPEASSPFSFALDIQIGMPGNVFVRGRGLDSEWKGDLKVKGTGNAPAIIGDLTTIRGTFDFLGKRFTVTDGAIHFFGNYPPEPIVDVRSQAAAKDITARLLVQGRASSLDIKLESDPPLPSDEILARILFNTGMGSINPLQVLMLADGLRALSGRGSALDLLGRSREFLGLAQLELVESGDQGVGLGIGKYLTKGIYVDVTKGVGDSSGRVSVKIDLTPNIFLQTEAGLDSTQGIGILYRRDY